MAAVHYGIEAAKILGRSVQPNLVNLGIWTTNFQPYDGQLGAAEVTGGRTKLL
jgi:hypothetical protein